MARQPPTDAPGIIEGNVLYTAEECQRRLRLAYAGWRQLRRAGLEAAIRSVGGRTYVLGDDVLQVFKAMPGRGRR